MKKRDFVRTLYDLIIFSAIIMILYNFTQPHSQDGFDNKQYTQISAVFRSDADGKFEKLSLPHYVRLKKGEQITISAQIPEGIDADDFMMIYSNQLRLKVYLDEKSSSTYTEVNNFDPDSKIPAMWYTFPIKTGSDGKRFRIVYLAEHAAYAGWIDQIYVGDRTAILYHLVRANAFSLVTAFIIVVMGIFIQCYDLCMLRKTAIKQYRFMGSFAVLAGLQLILHTPVRQLYMQNIVYADRMETVLFVISLIPFFLYLIGCGKTWYNHFTLSGLLAFATGLTIHLIAKLGFKDNRLYFCYVLGLLVMCFLWGGRFIEHMVFLRRERMLRAKENDEKTLFLADMSHAIRTPVNTVMGMDTMIIRETHDPRTLDYAEEIKNAIASLLSIIDDILDFSKIESEKMEIVPHAYELSSLINDCYNMIIMRAKAKELTFYVSNDKAIPDGLYGDEMRIRQIIINLLSNAVKYTREGNIEFHIGYEIVSRDRINLNIAVKDTGIGIKPENMEKLFTSYERLDEIQNRGIEGTGLGLSITRKLVFLMNGKISVESEYGKGSIFRVSVPQRVIGNEPIGNYSDRIQEQRENIIQMPKWFAAPHARVLVVDDVEMNIRVMQALLQEAQIQVDTAEGGEACLEKVRENHYDMIFLDHMMPEPDGLETFRAMRKLKLQEHTPVIMLTANAVLGAREKYLAEGFDDYLSKPVEERELIRLCRQYLPGDLITEVDGDEKNNVINNIYDHKIRKLSDVLNIEEGMQFCMHKPDFYMEMIEDFLTTGRMQMIRDSYDAGQMDDYRIHVHALKSMAYTLGADDISEQAKALEKAAREDDMDYIRSNHSRLLQTYDALAERIRALADIEEKQQKKKKLFPFTEVSDLLVKAHDCARIFDLDGVNEAVGKLDECEFSGEMEISMKALRKAGDEIEFDDIQRITQNMLKQIKV